MSLRAALLMLVICVCAFPPQGLSQNFAPAVNYSTQQSLPDAIAQGDFDNDGNLDVIVANSGASSLSFFRGQGDGVFAPPITIPLTSDPNAQPAAVAAADFNGDGHLDLAVSFSLSSSIQVMLGNGDGTFQPTVSLAIPSLGQFPIVIQLTSVDLNGDHKPDLAAATSNGVAIFLNDGAGNFSLHTNVFPGQIIQNFVVADFNRDQQLDIAATVVSNTGIITGAVYLSFGNGDGTFQVPTPLPLTTNVPSGLAAGDLNGDGLPDLVVSDFGSVNLMLPANGGVTVALQQPDGTFRPTITLPGMTRPGAVIVADFNGDGNQDVAVLSGSSAANQPIAVLTYLGQGNAAFSPPTQFPVLAAPTAVVSGSFSGTNALDIVTTDLTSNAISVLVNRGGVSVLLSSSVDPSLIAQPVILTAAVIPRFAGTGTPSGSVIFADGADTLGLAPVNASGHASITANFNSPGTHSLTAVYGGGSFVGGASAKLNQVVSQAQASITLSSSVNPSQVGQSVTFLVTVSAVGTGPVPTGNVSLSSGGTVILGGTLDNTGKVALTTSSLTVGSDIITAQYAGDANYQPRTSSALTQTVNLNADTTTLAVGPNPSAFGQAVSFSATVTASAGGSATPSGTVTFTDGATSLGTATLDAAGVATLTLSSLTPGAHSIVAVYGGDTKFSSSTSASTALTVNKASTTTSLSGTPNPSVFGQAVVFSVTITGPANAGSPTGVVTFNDGPNSIGTASLNQGKATLSVNSLVFGPHSITASYSGDATFVSSASAALAQTVNKSSSTTTLSGIPNPSVFGQPVALTATVVASAGGSGTPTGIVTFSDGSVSLGTATLSQGKATFTVNSLSAGNHTISAAYAGDADFLPSSAAGTSGVTQVVEQSGTITALSSSVNPNVYGQVVTLTAVVTASGSGGGVPSGTLTFRDGSSLLGTAILDNTGKGSISISSMGTGSHSISAAYSGSTGYIASVSAALSQVTNRDSVVVTLTSAPSPSTVAQAIAVTMQVAPAAPGGSAGSAVPTGTVIVSDASSVVGTVALDSTGKASVSLSSLVAGSHSLSAAYQGDTNYSPGVSGPFTQVVNKIATSVTLVSSLNPTTNASAFTLTANVRSGSAGIPTGAVTLLDGAQQISSTILTSTGSATFALSGQPSGTHHFIVTYGGDSTFAASQSAGLDEIAVDSHSKVSLTSSANPVTASTAVTFVAVVTPALGGSANGGAVVFSNGNQTLATVPVTSSRATFTTSSLPVGQDQIIASYQAASSPGPFDGTSPVLVETVSPGKPDFGLSIQPAIGQVTAGGFFQAQLILTPVNGFTGPEATLCSGIPVGASCTVTPSTGTFDGKTPLKATIIVTTTAPKRDSIGTPGGYAKPRPPLQSLVLGFLPIAFGGVLICSRPRKRHSFLAIVILAGLLTGCGSGNSYSPPKPVRTPPGTYSLSIRSQSGSLVHSGSITLTVK